MMKDVSDEVHEIKASVNKILDILQSDNSFNKEGLVEQVTRIDNELDKLKVTVEIQLLKIDNKLSMLWFKIGVFSAGGGALVQFLWSFLSNVLNLK